MVTMSLFDFIKKDIKKMIIGIGANQQGNIHPLVMDEVERSIITLVLQETNYNLFQTAKLLGIGRSTLYRKIKSLKIPPAPKKLTSL